MAQRKTAQGPRRAERSSAKDAFGRAASDIRNWVETSPAARRIGANAAQRAGIAVGIGRGAVNTVKGVGAGAVFAARLAAPQADRLLSPPGQTARDQLVRSGQGAIGYVRRGVADPKRILRDIEAKGRQLNRDLNPAATPPAKTFAGELKRNFEIGKNQGEVALDTATMVAGGGGLKALKVLGGASKSTGAAKYIAQGFSPKHAEYLAAPYKGMGSHYIPRRGMPKKVLGYELPKAVADLKLPRAISDSPFNVLKPKGISRGEMYERHYQVDSHFHGARLPGGGAWSGKKVGLKKHGTVGRVVHGAPDALKSTVGKTTVAGTTIGNRSGERRRPPPKR